MTGKDSLLESLFCGGVIRARDRAIKSQDKLVNQLEELVEDYNKCKTDYKEEKKVRRKAEREVRSLKREVNSLTRKNTRLLEDNTELDEEVFNLEKDVKWYEERRKTLENALREAFVLPDIELDPDELVLYAFDGWDFVEYDTRFGDSQYYLLPYEKWIEILAPIQKEVKEALGKWRENVSDCDDWAYVMGAAVVQFFVKAGIDKQGTFMIVWDITGMTGHAYNAFIDTDKNVWIYEPQSGEIIGKLGETTGDYESSWVWFPG